MASVDALFSSLLSLVFHLLGWSCKGMMMASPFPALDTDTRAQDTCVFGVGAAHMTRVDAFSSRWPSASSTEHDDVLGLLGHTSHLGAVRVVQLRARAHRPQQRERHG